MPPDAGPTSRRRWLQAALAATLSHPGRAWSRGAFADYPFALGVASGVVDDDSVVLWTRLVGGGDPPSTLAGPARRVRWELADDPGFARIRASGSSDAVPRLAHAVHVQAGGLPADRPYWYRFLCGDAVSPTGCTRTLPPAGADVARLRFAFASCQRWEQGRYAAWRHLVDDDPALVVFLGDYIYEYPAPLGPVRRHLLGPAWTLADYRTRYALYKSDPNLQRAHAACPWLVTWDDHEVQNDYASDRSQDLAPDFATRRAAAYQAWYEHQPVPASVLRAGLGGLGEPVAPGGPAAVRAFRRVPVGRLATFHLLDTRQHRDWQACPRPGRGGSRRVDPNDCPDLLAPQRTLLGAAQESWLDAGIGADASNRIGWTVLAQQTLFVPRDLAPGPGESRWTDGWDGYPAARRRLLDQLAARRPRNAVFIGGDLHENWVARVHADPDRDASPVLASEFCGTSITSRAGNSPAAIDAILRSQPHLLLGDGRQRGYQLVELTGRQWTSHLRVLDDASREDATVGTLARFVVDDGRPGPQRA